MISIVMTWLSLIAQNWRETGLHIFLFKYYLQVVIPIIQNNLVIYAGIPPSIDLKGDLVNSGQLSDIGIGPQLLIYNNIRDIISNKSIGKRNESLVSHLVYNLLNNLQLNDQVLLKTTPQFYGSFYAKVNGIRLKGDKIRNIWDFVIQKLSTNEIILNLGFKAFDSLLEKVMDQHMAQLKERYSIDKIIKFPCQFLPKSIKVKNLARSKFKWDI